MKEADFFGDIVTVPYMDHYDLVVLKTIAIYEYEVRKLAAKYIMKCDDDTFFRLEAVMWEVKKVHGGPLYMGNINYYHKPLRYGKWAVTCEVLGSGFEVITVGKKEIVRSVPTELNKYHNEILELAQAQGFVTVQEVERRLSWSSGRAIDALETLLDVMMAIGSACKDDKYGMENGKYVRYTPEQVEALERLYHDCPKPSSLRRQQLIRECHILSIIEPKQIKVWFQNRREKQRKEASRLKAVNRKLSAMNKLLMEENDRLQKQVSQLVYESTYFRQQTQNANLATTDTSCESVVTSGQHHLTPRHPPRDASPAGLLSIAEETLAEFLSKATGTAVEWVQPGPDSIGIVAISHGCAGVIARACGLVGLDPTRVAEILKDRPSWFRDCRAVDVLNVMSTGNGGTIELLYMQHYAPTTLAPARDFWLLRYTSVLEDGSLIVCERSLNNTQNGPSMPPVQHFVRAEVLPSGFLIRPCEGGGSIICIVDHMDLELKLISLMTVKQEKLNSKETS